MQGERQMPEPAKAVPKDFERDDIELVKLFLSQYKDSDGNFFNVTARPDTVERKEKAIEAIAENKHGHRLAVEHTLIQPFEGKMADDVPFTTVFEQLRNDESLRLPNRFIDVLAPTFAIPTGVKWEDVGVKVYEWFKGARQSFPGDGESQYAIPNLGFELKVLVQTMEIPGTDGVVVVGRILPVNKPFIDVLQKALATKVPKLVATPAEKHILLLEDNGVAIGFVEVTTGIDSSVDALPDLKKVSEVWIAHTMGWKTSGDVLFVHIWRGGVKERFWVKDERFSDKKPA
jgi:hypothetical protein